MKKLSILLACVILTMMACTKSKEVHPEIGDGNEEILKVNSTSVHVKYILTNIADYRKMIFHYGLTDTNGNSHQFEIVEMTKQDNCFSLLLNNLLSDTLYCYYFELFPNNGEFLSLPLKTFHTLVSDNPESPSIEGLPSVNTLEVTNITANSAVCGGEILDNDDSEIIECGICWSINLNPTLVDSFVLSDSIVGLFSLTINNLEANTTYYIRAFATNNIGTAYGPNKVFTTGNNSGLPVVETHNVEEITTNSAVCGGAIISDGGSEVTERGICWGLSFKPTLDDNHLSTGSGMGEFTETMSGLEANTSYYVRAYAINANGTAYGIDKMFTTYDINIGEIPPEGAISGLFSVSETTRVFFSQGNLQYQASTDTWRFAEHQWNYVGGTDYYGEHYGNVNGSSNNEISSEYSGWIDLFGWGTSGWNNGNLYYQPYDYAYYEDSHNGYGYGPTDGSNYTYDLTGQYSNADWGVYNAISNGGNQSGLWRTLSMIEWNYVFYYRNTPSGIRYAKAHVNDVKGVILLPDDWNSSVFTLNNYNQAASDFNSNVISATEWIVLEENGAVFLPAIGIRHGVLFGLESALYWSASCIISANAYLLCIGDPNIGLAIGPNRYAGLSVRLVQNAY